MTFTGNSIYKSFDEIESQYPLLYLDPSWPYNKYSNTKIDVGDKKRRITPYRPMSIEDLKKLPIPEISEKNSVLLMWATGPHNNSAIEVMKAWGFEYVTWQYSWLKRTKNTYSFHRGYGHYTQSNLEVCLLGKKGKGLKVLRHDIPQAYDGPPGEHSEKPDIFRQRTIQMFGDIPRLEGFARIKPHGWDAVGDEIEILEKPLEAFS
ncbi:MAG: MT-A70 family methyltransferase [Nitrosopumilus sp.]